MPTNVNATVIIQGKNAGTSTSYNGLLSYQGLIDRFAGRAQASFSPLVTHDAVVAIAGHCTLTPNAISKPTPVFATVALHGLVVNIPIDQILARCTAVFRSAIAATIDSFRARASFLPNAQVIAGPPLSLQGRGKLGLTATVTGGGTGTISGTVVFHGTAKATLNRQVIHDAQLVLEAGYEIFFPLSGVAPIRPHGTLTPNALLTHDASVLLSGHCSLNAAPTLGNNFNIYSGVHFAGRATGTFAVVPTNVYATLALRGTCRLTPVASSTGTLTATVALKGKATGAFLATAQGSSFNNAVVHVAGKGAFTPLAFKLVEPTAILSTVCNGTFIPRASLQPTLLIQGRCIFTPQTPGRTIQFSSSDTIQYKVWQYNTENMVRVLGTSWTVTSIGLTFMSVALEVVQTEAGWGS